MVRRPLSRCPEPVVPVARDSVLLEEIPRPRDSGPMTAGPPGPQARGDATPSGVAPGIRLQGGVQMSTTALRLGRSGAVTGLVFTVFTIAGNELSNRGDASGDGAGTAQTRVAVQDDPLAR